MKRLIIVAMLLLSLQLHAQQFEWKSQTTLPPLAIPNDLAWVDMDNDSLLDIMVVASTVDETQFILLYKVDTIPPDSVPIAIFKDSIDAAGKNLSWYLTDADMDNDMDILISGEWTDGPATMLAVNEGDFTFTIEPFLKRSGRILKLADLDHDGRNELILAESDSSGTSLSILRRTSSGWETAMQWLDTEISAAEVFDFDRDGFNDLFLSGKMTDSDSIVCELFYSTGDLGFVRNTISPPVAGSTSIADLDGNGYFDILLTGKDSLSRDTTIVLFNTEGRLSALTFPIQGLSNANVFAADLNSDGKCDVLIHGYTADSDTVNLISYNSSVTQRDTLNISRLHTQRFGDADRDGDLDLLQGIATDSGFSLAIYLNQTSVVNKPPQVPYNPFGVTIFNRLFLYWENSIDDHTDSASLTYDLVVQIPGQEWIAVEFDHLWLKRLTVSHGNTGNRNFALLHAPASPAFTFTVQAVDNAFHAGADDAGSGGVCTGTSIDCTNLEYKTIEVCRNESVRLSAPGDALWFSFSSGFLTKAPYLDYNTSVADTVFSVLPEPGAGCNAVKAYTFRILNKVVRKTMTEKYVCEGEPVILNTEPGWQSTTWSSSSKGFVSTDASIAFTPAINDTLTVTLNDGTGCIIERSTIFQYSKPVIVLNSESFQIMRGSQVQLGAEGGQNYLWSPATGLDYDTIPNPIAAPYNTTTYTVALTDSIGCSAEAKVLVMVETVAFVPNLFTPNDDGKNDELKIYGLEEVKNFTFTIHNREGNLVYETHSAAEATSAGWNGMLHGNRQPAGVYYWKVKGEYPSGRKVLLNEKSSGFIVLVR